MTHQIYLPLIMKTTAFDVLSLVTVLQKFYLDAAMDAGRMHETYINPDYKVQLTITGNTPNDYISLCNLEKFPEPWQLIAVIQAIIQISDWSYKYDVNEFHQEKDDEQVWKMLCARLDQY